MYTETKNGIVERRELKNYPVVAGLTPQQLDAIWTEQMGYASASYSTQIQNNLKTSTKMSVDALVNDKLGEFGPTSLQAVSAFGPFSRGLHFILKKLFKLNEIEFVVLHAKDFKSLQKRKKYEYSDLLIKKEKQKYK